MALVKFWKVNGLSTSRIWNMGWCVKASLDQPKLPSSQRVMFDSIPVFGIRPLKPVVATTF